MKVVLFVFLMFYSTSAYLFFNTRELYAKVVINEISPASDPEWVELFNDLETSFNLQNCFLWLDDSAESQKIVFDSSNVIDKYFVIKKGEYNWSSNWLNNSGDKVSLECPNNNDEITYGPGGLAIVPDNNESIGRFPDGGEIYDDAMTVTPNEANIKSEKTVSSPKPADSSETKANKAVYKIEKSKDQDGNELSRVEIYVDGKYVHHFDEEILEFFDNHECYSGVPCGLGDHTITLKKEGYQEWSETKSFNQGDSYTASPILKKQKEEDANLKSTTKPTVLAKATTVPKNTFEGDDIEKNEETNEDVVLGLRNGEDEVKDDEVKVADEKERKLPVLSFIFIAGSLSAFGFAGYSYFRTKELNKGYNEKSAKGKQDIKQEIN